MDTTRQRKLDRLKRELYISDNSDIEEIIEEVMEEVIEKDSNSSNVHGSLESGNNNVSSVAGSASHHNHHYHHHHSDHPFKRKRDVERIDYNDNKRRANYILKSPVKKKDNTGRQNNQQQSSTNAPLFNTSSHYNTRSNTSKGSSSSNSGSNNSTAKPSRRSSRQHESVSGSGKINQVKEETVSKVIKKDNLGKEIVRPDEKNVKVFEDVTEFDADDEHQDAENEENTGISGDIDTKKSSTEEIVKSEEVQKDKNEVSRVESEERDEVEDEGEGEESEEEVYEDEEDDGEEEEGEEEEGEEEEEEDDDDEDEDDVDEDDEEIDLLEDDKKTQQLESESEFESFVRDAVEDDKNEQLEEDEGETNVTFKQSNTNFTNSIIDESWLERIVRHDLEKKISVLGDSTDTGTDFLESNTQNELGIEQISETDTKSKSKSTPISASASASLSPPSESTSSVPISESVNDELKNLYENKSLEIINERCMQIDKVVAEIDAEIAAVKKNRLSHRPALYTNLFAPLFERTAAKVAIAERLQKYKLDQATEIARINKETTNEQFFTAFDENRKHLKNYVQSQLQDLDIAIANRVKVPAKATARETANTAGMELLADIVTKCAFDHE